MRVKPVHPLAALLSAVVESFDEETHPTRTTPRPGLGHTDDHDGQDPEEPPSTQATGPPA